MILQPLQILFINSWRTHRCGLNALVVSYRNFVCGSWWALMSQLIVVKSPLRLFSHITEWMRPADTHLAADNSSYANRAAAAGGWKEGWMWKNSVILSLKYIFRLIPIPPTHTHGKCDVSQSFSALAVYEFVCLRLDLAVKKQTNK